MFGRLRWRIGPAIAALGLLLGSHTAGPAHAQSVEWVSQFGGSASDFVTAVARGSDTSFYVAGFTATEAGDIDAFVRKFNAQGTLQWNRQFGTPGIDMALALAVSFEDDVASDGVFVAGFVGDGQALPGQITAGKNDAFVRRYNPDGDIVWTRQFGSSDHDEISAISVNSNSALIVAGATLGSLFAPNAGGADVFLRRYRPNGSTVWTQQFGSAGDDLAMALAARGGGLIYVAGLTSGALPGQTSMGGIDAFIRRIDGLGREKWTKQFGTAGLDEVWGVAISAGDAAVYVAGGTNGALGPSPAGEFDAFVRKYHARGTEEWTRQFGTAANDEAFGLGVGSDGSVFVVGATGGTFDGETSHGGFDGFIRNYTAKGVHRFTRQLGTAGFDDIGAIHVSPRGDIFLVGSTTGTFPGQTRSGEGDEDSFVLKFNPPARQ